MIKVACKDCGKFVGSYDVGLNLFHVPFLKRGLRVCQLPISFKCNSVRCKTSGTRHQLNDPNSTTIDCSNCKKRLSDMVVDLTGWANIHLDLVSDLYFHDVRMACQSCGTSFSIRTLHETGVTDRDMAYGSANPHV